MWRRSSEDSEMAGKLSSLTEGDHRCTPESVVQAVKWFRRIWLDPCWNSAAITMPLLAYDGSPGRCGLKNSWRPSLGADPGGPGCIFVNPPWSDIKPWAHKVRLEYNRTPDLEILVWTPAYFETGWAQVLWQDVRRVALWKTRPHHPTPQDRKGSSKWPTMMWYFGQDVDRFYREFNAYAYVLERVWR